MGGWVAEPWPRPNLPPPPPHLGSLSNSLPGVVELRGEDRAPQGGGVSRMWGAKLLVTCRRSSKSCTQTAMEQQGICHLHPGMGMAFAFMGFGCMRICDVAEGATRRCNPKVLFVLM